MASGTQACRAQDPPELNRITDVVVRHKPKPRKHKRDKPKRKEPQKAGGKKGESAPEA